MNMGLNIGKPTGVCQQCGASLVRFVDFTETPVEVEQKCTDCEE